MLKRLLLLVLDIAWLIGGIYCLIEGVYRGPGDPQASWYLLLALVVVVHPDLTGTK